jgi:hypothetical protein
MKTVIAIVMIVALASCGGAATSTPTSTDSTKVDSTVKVDSVKVESVK